MDVTIIGAGALGTIIGAHLIEAGHAVTMIARGARAKDLSEHGLRVRGLNDLTLPCKVVADPTQAPGETEVLVYAVKTYHMADPLVQYGAIRTNNVVSVANGVMKNEQLADTYGPENVLGCMADTSGELHEDGVVEFTRNVGVAIGAYAPPSNTDPSALAAALDGAGVVTRAVENIATVEWSKFAPWSAMFTLALMARRPTWEYLSNPDFARIAVGLAREAGDVATALGVTLDDKGPLPAKTLREASLDEGIAAVLAVGKVFAENAPTHKMSSLQDLEAGRQLEVNETLGYLVTKAAAHGISAPTLDICYRAARGIDGLT